MKTHTFDIHKLRARLGLSQADFGVLMGVNQATVSKWETGSIAISRLAHQALERLDREATNKRWARRALKRLNQEAA